MEVRVLCDAERRVLADNLALSNKFLCINQASHAPLVDGRRHTLIIIMLLLLFQELQAYRQQYRRD